MSANTPPATQRIEDQWPFPGQPLIPEQAFVGAKDACNVVMKGGITSGVVYPATVIHLARKYRFRSIGGTSAGAMAAVALAAAEYGRVSSKTGASFVAFQQLSNHLTQGGVLANLFQPTPATRPLLNAGLQFLALQRKFKQKDSSIEHTPWLLRLLGPAQSARLGRWWNIASSVVTILQKSQQGNTTKRQQQHRTVGLILALLPFLVFAFAAIVAAACFAIAGITIPPPIWFVMLISAILTSLLVLWCFGWLFPVGWSIYDVLRMLLQDIPNNAFGICTGLSVGGHPAAAIYPDSTNQYQSLTDWFNTTIQTLAGKTEETAQPVTFGDLKQQGIDLRVVTTNLSRTHPFVIPFSTEEFLFNEGEMRSFFPSEIVDFMIQHAPVWQGIAHPPNTPTNCVFAGNKAADRYYVLPTGDNLPIIVAARMSLSLPLLLSAIPLYSLAPQAQTIINKQPPGANPYTLRHTELQRNWFSDGGICSNFPIHFFDTWFPDIPTFGINLDELPPSATDAQAQPQSTANAGSTAQPLLNDVWLPSSYREELPAITVKDKADLIGFLWSIIDTGINYHDMLQARLPSYYDRIATIRLSEVEGGLNLEMPPEIIQTMREKGAIAGIKIDRYFNLDHHRWVRLLILLRELEEQALSINPAIQGTSSTIQQLITQEVAKSNAHDAYPFARDQQWETDAQTRLAILQQAIAQWSVDPAGFFQQQQPDTTHIQLRITPDL